MTRKDLAFSWNPIVPTNQSTGPSKSRAFCRSVISDISCPMDNIANRREEIYNYFHANHACQKYFFDSAHEDEYVGYYNSMYLLHDSTESLWWHRKQGFARDPLQAYLEFWGLMQAVTIQQDSIVEIFKVITGNELDSKTLLSWSEIRNLRNVCAGHPAKRDRPKRLPLTRTFMGRMFGGYESFKYERWEQGVGTTHPDVKLAALLDAYAVEAEAKLVDILNGMRTRWS